MKLEDLTNKLLNLGKRNRLLNYKETGFKSISILNKNYREIYEGLTSGKEFSFMLIDPMLERYHKTFAEEGDSILEYSPLKVYDICKEAIKPKELLAYKKGYKLDKTLRALLKEYKYSINEKGINSLYLTFGFVSYKEDNVCYQAPLLLIPVEYQKNMNGVYKICASDDDIILNPTLDYFFNTTRKFDIPNYYTEDFDFDIYMEQIKKVLPEDVIYFDGMSLGIYSFLKMNMYRDLKDHEAKVLQNRNINALLGNSLDGDITLDGKALPVVNCDSSQYAAIEMAVKGKSFTLQGPPGSGKSQTITNIIASLIGNGRHVLFVSEKLQALQVVYEKLKRAGLSEFAIELHSSKANKKTFIDNLYKTATLPKYSVSNMAEDTKENHAILKAELDNYKKAIDSKVEGEEITVFELFSLYMNEREVPLDYRFIDISSTPLQEMDNTSRNLREYKDAIAPIGYDYRDSVFYVFNDMNKSYITYEMNKEFTDAIAYIIKLESYRKNLNKYISIQEREILSIDDLYKVFDFIPAFNQLEYHDLLSLSKDNLEYVLPLMKEYLCISLASSAMKNYDKEFVNIDVNCLYRKLKSHTGLFKSFNKEYRDTKREILSYRDDKASHKVLVSELKEIVDLKERLFRRKVLKESISKYIPYENTENMEAIKKDVEAYIPFAGIRVSYSSSVEKNTVKNYILYQMLSFKNYQDGDINLRKLQVIFDSAIFNFYKSPLSVVSNHLNEMYKKKDLMQSYIRVLAVLKELKKDILLEFLHTYLKTGLCLENMDSVYRKTFMQNKIFDVIQKNPILSSFSSSAFKDKVKEFVSLDEAIMRLNRDYIIAVNSMKRPDDVLLEGSQFQILAKEANKIKRQKPVRLLLSEIYDFSVTIKRVFLMSPLSVSTYLTEDNEFDCVIFDEASQIFAKDAFGAIYRGKQCIIIGDSKQMPPSNFFNAISDDNDDEDYESVDESILDMGTSYLPTTSLKWHYRSRSEELIAFSNKEFYDSTLITIPEAKKHEVGFGIDFINVKDGIYNVKSRTNQREAELIADMVISHYQKSNKSMGVVAFSKVQAELFEDMVDEKISKYPEVHKYFTDEVEEPFFVKNLETVQGDERDRIIFSICYGYNNDGKFYQRFGPLNNLGGERRLNVAVTRSKYNITIISSIKASDIRDNTTDSIGVKLLKEYLDFAENVLAKKNYTESDNGIINSIKEFLEESHYICYTNYGSSSFRIPLAVKENEEDSFKAAIMIDGMSRNNNTTDTNRLEEMLLSRQGWKYYKIYSPSYIEDMSQEQSRLLDFLRNNVEEEHEEESSVESFIVESKDTLESHFKEYEAMPNEILMKNYMNKGLVYALLELLKKEEPIHNDYFLRKCAVAMGKTRITNVVKNEASKAVPESVTIVGNTIWLNPRDTIDLRIHSDRMLNEIPMEELKEGLYTIVSYSEGLTVEGAFKAILKLLGFSRLTDNTKKLLMDAVDYLKLEGRIIQRGECLYI
jgi:superfamily I DNA and/or RNA helicase